MAEKIEKANNAYEARDKANDAIENLKNQAKTEAQYFENELKQLSEYAEGNRKIMEKLSGNQNREDSRAEHEAYDSENYNQRNSENLKEARIDPKLQEENNSLKLDYAKIQAATNINQFDEIIKNFVEMEENNFSMFKYVVDLLEEMETIEKHIADLKDERSLYLGKGNEQNKKKNTYIKELDDRSLRSQKNTEFYESKYNQCQKGLNSAMYNFSL